MSITAHILENPHALLRLDEVSQEWSKRAKARFEQLNLVYLLELVELTHAQLLHTRRGSGRYNFGRTSCNEVIAIVESRGFCLGMEVIDDSKVLRKTIEEHRNSTAGKTPAEKAVRKYPKAEPFSVKDIRSAPDGLINSLVGGLVSTEGKLSTHTLLTVEEIARKLGEDPEYVLKQHASGALYAASFDGEAIDEICKARPNIIDSIPTLLSFRRQGKLLFYPAWQVRNHMTELELPAPDQRIYPEVALAREAYVVFARRVNEVEQQATDEKLNILFNSTGGLFEERISDHIVSQDAQTGLRRSLTLDELVHAWGYAINPSGVFHSKAPFGLIV